MQSGREKGFKDYDSDSSSEEEDLSDRERAFAAGVGRGGRLLHSGEFGWDDIGDDMDRTDIKRERTVERDTGTAVVLRPGREGSAPPALQGPVNEVFNEAQSEDDMDDLFQVRVQTLPDGVVSTRDLRCVSCFARYADVGVFPCGHVCTYNVRFVAYLIMQACVKYAASKPRCSIS